MNIEDERSGYFKKKRKGRGEKKENFISLEVLNAISTSQGVSMPKPGGGTHVTLTYVLRKKMLWYFG